MPEDYNVNFRVYGKDRVMGKSEPAKKPKVHELCPVTDVVAKNQELANTVCTTIRAILLHHGYSGTVRLINTLKLFRVAKRE